MITSYKFWAGAVLLALVPVFLMDLPKHFLDWQDEVYGQIIGLVQNTYSFSRQQKADILTHIFSRNHTLTFSILLESIAALVCFVTGLILIIQHNRLHRYHRGISALSAAALTVLFIGIKVIFMMTYTGLPGVKFIDIPENQTSLKSLYNDQFKNKVVYIDFWGTTCPGCLEEFTYFTQPLKAKFTGNPDVVFLYICQGTKYFWKQRIRQFNLLGYHAFVSSRQYDQLYRDAVSNKGIVYMPRYVLINKEGKFVADIKEPSSTDTLYRQLAAYLR